MSTPPTEAWQRGPVPGVDPYVMPVVHALIQAREDLARLARDVPHEDVWRRPGGAASIGFHVRHAAGALDRLLTYARGEALNERQRQFARDEGTPGEPAPTLASVLDEVDELFERAMAQLRTTRVDTLLEHRAVGRAGLPSTVLGLLVHAAEHTTRHVGQAITTARILAGGRGQEGVRPVSGGS